LRAAVDADLGVDFSAETQHSAGVGAERRRVCLLADEFAKSSGGKVAVKRHRRALPPLSWIFKRQRATPTDEQTASARSLLFGHDLSQLTDNDLPCPPIMVLRSVGGVA